VVLWAMAVGMEGALLWVSAALGWTLLALAAMDLRTFILSDVLTIPLTGLTSPFVAPPNEAWKPVTMTS